MRTISLVISVKSIRVRPRWTAPHRNHVTRSRISNLTSGRFNEVIQLVGDDTYLLDLPGMGSKRSISAVRPPRRTTWTSLTQSIGGDSSLRQYRVHIEVLGTDFGPDDYLRSVAGFGGMVAGRDFAGLFQVFNVD